MKQSSWQQLSRQLPHGAMHELQCSGGAPGLITRLTGEGDMLWQNNIHAYKMRLFGMVEIGPRIASHLFSVASAEFTTIGQGERTTQRAWVVGAVAMRGGEITKSTVGNTQRAQVVRTVPVTDSFTSSAVTFGRNTPDSVPSEEFVALDNVYISGTHASLLFTKGANPLVVDAQSKGGTFVNTPEFFANSGLVNEWAPTSTDVYRAYIDALR